MQDFKVETSSLKRVELSHVPFYVIENVEEKIPPFFMTMVSAFDHWLFMWSNGALSAGRKNADFALFPYYTDDKIYHNNHNTGCKTIIQITDFDKTEHWEPFSDCKQVTYKTQRNLYKSIYGNQIVFEEINHTLQLTFRYSWSSSQNFGFVRQSSIINHNPNSIAVKIVDGFQNLLPYGVNSDLQNAYSNLVNAYKSSELLSDTQLGIYALSAIIVDRAEPSEALKCNTVWHKGLSQSKILLSDSQIHLFRQNKTIIEEKENKGNSACYYVTDHFELKPQEVKDWFIIANVNQSQAQVVALQHQLSHDDTIIEKVKTDIVQGTQHLIQLIAQADGLQQSADTLKNTRHFSNVVFNTMRGGIFSENYQIEKNDFLQYIYQSNRKLYLVVKPELEQLSDKFHSTVFRTLEAYKKVDFYRLSQEYLPLYFSRRHGDPSRPWNKFSINTQHETTQAKILDYQGNWRDIFQNWEALAFSYPFFAENMLFKFLNATNFEGYNPYRVAKNGFDWETIEPDNPWSYIGYWGDHQIIYLLKFLEFIERLNPDILYQLFDKEVLVYAHIPYKIKPFRELIQNPKNSIVFDSTLDKHLRESIAQNGFDAAFLTNRKNQLHYVNFIEKIVATVLSKLSNFIPEAGIWMNTQRPEWNDANNALVGNGTSMVTLYYLRRFLTFFEKLIAQSTIVKVSLSSELLQFFEAMRAVFQEYQIYVPSRMSDAVRFDMVEKLGEAASQYRQLLYQSGFSGEKELLKLSDFQQFIQLSLVYIEKTITLNQRKDKLFHAYNLAHFSSKKIRITPLQEMLEGQVAVLSSGYLQTNQVVELLEQLRNSKLYREDQHSYMLYPNKKLPSFLEKNTFSVQDIEHSLVLKKMIQHNDTQIIEQDVLGNLHFHAQFKNSSDLEEALLNMDREKYQDFTEKEIENILVLYEKVFNHKEFTGRSGTFYAYEGLGSIYWHMVSKLALAVQETIINAQVDSRNEKDLEKLIYHYYDIVKGLGLHKSVQQYGAYPTDAYSHTPFGKGVQQPGMTGQVKEDILCRWGELGLQITNSSIRFNPFFLQKSEWNTSPSLFEYYDINQELQVLPLERNSIAFTYCQIPIVYQIDDEKIGIVLYFANGETEKIKDYALNTDISKWIGFRTQHISKIEVYFSEQFFQNLPHYE